MECVITYNRKRRNYGKFKLWDNSVTSQFLLQKHGNKSIHMKREILKDIPSPKSKKITMSEYPKWNRNAEWQQEGWATGPRAQKRRVKEKKQGTGRGPLPLADCLEAGACWGWGPQQRRLRKSLLQADLGCCSQSCHSGRHKSADTTSWEGTKPKPSSSVVDLQ